MLKKRLTAAVTIRNGLVVQSFGYNRYLPIGKPKVVVENLDRWGCDEIFIQVIDRSTNNLGPDIELVKNIASSGILTPIMYAGGIQNENQASQVIRAGAERVCLDGLLHKNSSEIKNIAKRLGSQAVIGCLPLGMDDSGTVYWYNYQIKKTDYHTELNSTQSHLAIIIPSVTRNHPDYHSLLVANYIFGGGGFGSWLMKEIREKRGLSYSVYSYLGSNKNQGYMRITLQTKNENLALTKKIIFSQIERLKKFDVKENKIETVKKSILKNFEMRTDTNRKILNLISAINNLNLPLNYFENYKNKLMSVNKESIRKALDSSIDFENISVMSVGKSIE